MRKNEKHIHFEWPNGNINFLDEIEKFATDCTRTPLEAMEYARGKIIGCNEVRNDLFYAFIRFTFRAGVKYGMDNKDKMKITEHLDSECDKTNEEGANGLYV